MNDTTDRRQEAMDILGRLGWSPAASAGIVGNLIQESGLDPTKVHDRDPKTGLPTGLGIAGWRDPPGTSNGRRTQLRQFAAARGTSDTDLETQLSFLDHELRTSEAGVGDRLRGAQTATDAATIFIDFERPQGWSKANPRGGHGWAARVQNALDVQQGFFGGVLPDDVLTSGAVPAVPLTQDEETQQKVQANRAWEDVAGGEDQVQKRLGLLRDAASIQWLVARLFEPSNPELADPNFTMTDEYLKDLQERYRLPDEYLGYFSDAHSRAQAEWYGRQARERMGTEQRLAAAGITGVGAQLIAAATDPVGLTVGIATGGIGAAIARGAQVGRIGTAAIIGGTEAAANVVFQGAVNAADPVENDPTSLLVAGGAGLVFGSLFGSLSKSGVHIQPELEDIARAGASVRQAALEGTAKVAPDGSAGAMFNPAVRQPLRDDLGPWTNMGDAAPETAFGPIRIDRVGRLKQSEVEFYRALGNVMGEDAVGNKKTSLTTVIGATEEQRRLHASMTTQNDQVFSSAYAAWAKSRNLNWYQKRLRMGEFNDEVMRFRRDTNPATVYDPEVVRAGRHQDALYDRFWELAANPGHLDGSVMPPLAGASGPKPAGRYAPRYFDWHKVGAFLDKYGTDGMERLVAKAFSDMLTQQPPAGLIERFAKSYVRKLSLREAGLETGLQRALSGDDADLLEETLKNAFGMDAADAEWIARGFRQSEDSAASPRLKARATLNDLAAEDLVNKTGAVDRGVSFDSLLVSDARQTFHMYSRDMSARIALGNMKIRDPDTGDFILQGIQKDSDWAKLLQVGRAAAADAGKSHAVEGAEKNLISLYKSLMGVPHESDLTVMGQGIRALMKFNFLRLMANMGLNQVVDLKNGIAQTGVKAYWSAISDFRGLRRDILTGQLKGPDINRELEAVLGIGTDPLKGTFAMNWTAPDEVIGFGASAALDRADRVLHAAGSAVSVVSGMRYVNSWLARAAAKSVAYKFGQYAKGVTPNWKRLASLGMDEPMLKRVVAQYQKHTTPVKGDLAKIDALNLDKWDDLEARAGFERTLYRWANRINQENDPGNLPHWLDSRVMKAIFQFRTFMLGAFSKQTLWNAHMRDPQALVSAALGLFTGSMTYMGVVYGQARGMDEAQRRRFVEERLSLKAIALNGFARTGESSIIPMLWDSTVGAVGTAAGHKDWTLFNYARASGQTQDILFGNPNSGLLLNDIPKALGSAVNLVDGSGLAQTDMKNFRALLPLANSLPAAGFFNSMIHKLPQRPQD